MNCPYCKSGNKKGATICAHCTHPMILPKQKETPLWEGVISVLILLALYLVS